MTALSTIPQNSTNKEPIIDENFKALSPAAIFSKNFSTTTGLIWGFFGGEYNKNDGTIITVNNGTISLTSSTLNYIFFNLTTNAVEKNTTGFLSNHIPLYEVTTNSSLITNILDKRVIAYLPFGTPSNFYTEPYVLPVATTTTIGGVKPDNTTIVVAADGTISSLGGSGGSGSGITTQQALLTTDVQLTTSNTFFDILSLTLTSGKYLITSNSNFQRAGTANTWIAALYDGTNYLANGSAYTVSASPSSTELSLSTILNITTTTTVKLQAQCSSGSTSSLVKATRIAGATSGATNLIALRLAD